MRALLEDVMAIVREHHFDRAAAEVFFASERGHSGAVVNQQRAETGRITKHFVKRHGDKVRRMLRQVQVVGGHVRGRVQNDVPPVRTSY